ncbi:MAG: hypothetical protein LBM64_03040, partial [Deltaproteobacteria bacterium]|nr:hypothetical protein [Deltaproteobacteria bacterium]
ELIRQTGWKLQWVMDPAKRGWKPQEIEARLLEQAREIEYLFSGNTPLRREFFAKAAKLRHVCMLGTGVDHIDLAAATAHGVPVSNTPGANAATAAEMVLAFMLALTRRLVPLHVKFMEGAWKGIMADDLGGKTLGIVGFGNIGQRVAKLARAFDMNVLFHNRTPRPDMAARLGCAQVGSLEELLPQSDFLSLNLPAVAGPAPLGRAELALMKPTAYVINTGRGNLVDLDALAEALAEGRLAGAGLDVFPDEPMTREKMEAMAHPLYGLRNVICTPHVAGISEDAGVRSCQMGIAAFAATMRGERAPNVLNPKVYER